MLLEVEMWSKDFSRTHSTVINTDHLMMAVPMKHQKPNHAIQEDWHIRLIFREAVTMDVTDATLPKLVLLCGTSRTESRVGT